jgi:4-amino-4-deoxy-L-arabinose transferase-like glycosyltransferase
MGVFIFYAFAVLLEAAILLFCYFGLKKRKRRVFWLTVAILALNVIVIVFDQIGVIDILYALVNLIAVIVLYLARREFLPE